MTDEQREKFRAARTALDKSWAAIQETYAPLMAIRPEKHGLEWDEAYLSLEAAIGKIDELLEAEEILMGLPERD